MKKYKALKVSKINWNNLLNMLKIKFLLLMSWKMIKRPKKVKPLTDIKMAL